MGPEEKCRPPHPSSRRTVCRPVPDHATILTVKPKPLITLTATPTLKTDRWAGGFRVLSQIGAPKREPRHSQTGVGRSGGVSGAALTDWTPRASADCPR